MIAEDRREDRLAAAVAVGVGGVDVVDAVIDCAADDPLRLFVCVVAPPAGRHGPCAEAELGELEIGVVKFAIAHRASLSPQRRDVLRFGSCASNVSSRVCVGPSASALTGAKNSS